MSLTKPELRSQTPPILLTETEVAPVVRKSVYWLRRKRWEGGPDSIPYRKLGSSVRYDQQDVLNWIEERPPQTSTSRGKYNAK